MIRQPDREQIHRLAAKTLDQVFVTRAQEGLGCSLFEAQALTQLVREVYFPWIAQPETVQTGQLALIAISADEPPHKPLSKCQMVPIVVTLYAARTTAIDANMAQTAWPDCARDRSNAWPRKPSIKARS